MLAADHAFRFLQPRRMARDDIRFREHVVQRFHRHAKLRRRFRLRKRIVRNHFQIKLLQQVGDQLADHAKRNQTDRAAVAARNRLVFFRIGLIRLRAISPTPTKL